MRSLRYWVLVFVWHLCVMDVGGCVTVMLRMVLLHRNTN